MQSSMPDEFPRLSSRLSFIELCSDQLKNMEVWHCLSVFESYVYGVMSQYKRINEDQAKSFSITSSSYSLTQLSLDIYYYTLTWDKLRKVFEKLKGQINNISKSPNTLPSEFKNDFRQLRIKIEHLLNEFRIPVRNEFEHPSLKPKKTGHIIEWGTLIQDSQGNIMAHAGNEEYAIVRKEHIERLNSLWIELIDIFVKHFTKKSSSSDLLLLKKQIEENIDMIINSYIQYRHENKDDDANQILHQIIMSEIYLSGEGIPLRQDIKNKFYSILAQR